eukprot:TRINITY_DN100872_c0_g1_i1.p1 TRINITY_DN100872_c0_g1~~TRINITY_DN100872_c0_g1_i1.p1  ORF type:complete len:875 (-),score=190.38 TRINITY_DN100872_c0_g1_i1:99-2723(-)
MEAVVLPRVDLLPPADDKSLEAATRTPPVTAVVPCKAFPAALCGGSIDGLRGPDATEWSVECEADAWYPPQRKLGEISPTPEHPPLQAGLAPVSCKAGLSVASEGASRCESGMGRLLMQLVHLHERQAAILSEMQAETPCEGLQADDQDVQLVEVEAVQGHNAACIVKGDEVPLAERLPLLKHHRKDVFVAALPRICQELVCLTPTREAVANGDAFQADGVSAHAPDKEAAAAERKHASNGHGHLLSPKADGSVRGFGPDDSGSMCLASPVRSMRERVGALLPVWQQSIDDETLESLQLMQNSKQDSADNVSEIGDNDKAKVEPIGFWQRHMIGYPASPPRLAWDILGAVLIFYDVVVLPLTPYNIPEDAFMAGVDLVALSFWSLNVVASVTVGFVQDGITVMDPKRIVMNYLKKWFIIDMLVVVPDWVAIIVGGQGDSGDEHSSTLKLFNLLRILRIIRLVRLLKLKRLIAVIMDMLDSEYSTIMFYIVQMIMLMILINHLCACCWFAVSRLNKNNWVVAFGADHDDWIDNYLLAFHWCLTQFTPASKPALQPQNQQERIFAISMVVFALVGFSYVVGSITQSLGQLRNLNEARSVQLWTLRRYLRINHVSLSLSMRVQKYIEHQLQLRRDSMQDSSAVLLKDLSEQLLCELKCEMSVPHLAIHPLFEHMSEHSMVTMRRIASGAVARKSLAQSDTVFLAGETATHMAVVVGGRLRYDRNVSGKLRREWVDKREDWISEPCLWLKSWVQLGELIAATPCELLHLRPGDFANIVQKNATAYVLALRYSSNYLKWMAAIPWGELSDITQGDIVSDQLASFLQAEPVNKSTGHGDGHQATSVGPGSETWRKTKEHMMTSLENLRASMSSFGSRQTS